jgi:hypothetical protein
MNVDDFNKMFGNGGKIFIIYFSYLLYLVLVNSSISVIVIDFMQNKKASQISTSGIELRQQPTTQ